MVVRTTLKCNITVMLCDIIVMFSTLLLLGKGTTHNTNGIILQRKCDIETCSQESIVSTTSCKRTRQRSLQAPVTQLAEYHRKQRHGPAATAGELSALSVHLVYMLR